MERARKFWGRHAEARARRKAAEQAIGNVDFEVATLDGLDARPESFDAVLAPNVLRMLAPFGRVVRLLPPVGFFATAARLEAMAGSG